LKFVIWQKY